MYIEATYFKELQLLVHKLAFSVTQNFSEPLQFEQKVSVLASALTLQWICERSCGM